MKCTFEKRKRFRVWVEPLEHNDPSTEPPVVELSLSVSHLVLGKTERGKNAVRTTSLPCTCFFFWFCYRQALDGTDHTNIITTLAGSIQYEIRRLDEDQEAIRARREIAYKRQESMAASHPDADPSIQIESGTSVETLDQDAASESKIVELAEAPRDGAQ